MPPSEKSSRLVDGLWISPLGEARVTDVWAVAGVDDPNAMDVDDYYALDAVVDRTSTNPMGWCKPKPPLDWEGVLQWARARLAEWALSRPPDFAPPRPVARSLSQPRPRNWNGRRL